MKKYRPLKQIIDSLRTPFQQRRTSKQIKYDPAKGEVALLIIDAQRGAADPKEGVGNLQTEQVSRRLRRLVPEFRKAGVPVYAVYYSFEGEKEAEKIDFFKFKPSPEDTLVAKNANSAFKGSNIDELLRSKKRKQLLICGFHKSACVYATVMDARANGYKVTLLDDMTADGNNWGIGWGDIRKKAKALKKVASLVSSPKLLRELQALGKRY